MAGLKLNTTIEVLGILSHDVALTRFPGSDHHSFDPKAVGAGSESAFARDEDGSGAFGDVSSATTSGNFEMETVAHDPPSSLVPRCHVVALR